MSIQFQRQYLMEDEDAVIQQKIQHLAAMLVQQCGAEPETAVTLANMAVLGGIPDSEAVRICKLTTSFNEEGGSGTGGAGGFLSSLHASEEDVKGPELEEAIGIPFNTADDYVVNGQTVNYKWIRDNKYVFQTQTSPSKTIEVSDSRQVQHPDGKPVVKEDAPILAGGKIKDNYAVSHFGYKKAPRGRAKLKGIIVKDLWEMFKGGSGPFYVVYNKGRGQGKGVSNEYQPFATEEEAQAFADKRNSWEVGMPGGGKYYYVVGPDHDDFEWVSQAAHDERQLDREMGEAINENYHRFKKETATRTKAQQMHEAAKAIERRLHEVNKLLEYTNELRNELFEGDSESQMTHHTKRVFEKVTKNIAEAYSKLKKIK